MGDRTNFGFRQLDNSIIYLYGHNAGYQMMGQLAAAIDFARPRWHDEMYATRMAISHLVGDDHDQELGWGIATHIGDNEHSIPVVNWSDQTVSLYSHSWSEGIDFTNPKFVMDFERFLSKFDVTLV
jgi:hypothetical protein